MTEPNEFLKALKAFQPQTHDPEYYIELAQRLPKIASNDPRVKAFETNHDSALKDPVQFGNNFFMLWQSLREDSPKQLRRVYRARALGLAAWEGFSGANTGLLEEIDSMLGSKAPVDELSDEWRRLLGLVALTREEGEITPEMEQLKAIHLATDHPFGISAIELHFWDRFNPLLETAASQLEAHDINPTQFYG